MKKKEFITKDYFLQHDKKGITQVNTLPTENIDFLSFYRLMEDKGIYTAGVYFWNNDAWEKVGSKVENLYITDINRLSDYLYKVDFDKLPPYKELDMITINGCTSFIKDRKLYRSYDFNYDESCEFLVRTNDFTGMAYIPNLLNGMFDMDYINQLPYHLVDGVNKHGIMASVHYLYNDFSHTSYTGDDKLPATKAIYYILANLTSIDNINSLTDLQKIEIPQSIFDEGYCLQFMVSDGTKTYTITPSNGSAMTITDISDYNNSIPRMTNFKIYKNGVVSLADSNIQTRPNGVERYNLIDENTTLEDLRFTKCYETTDYLSEFIGMGGTTKSSTTAQLESQYNIAKAEYDNRQRDGKTWQSVHAIVYSPSGIVSSLCVQEDYEKDYFKELKFDNQNIVVVDELPAENIDSNIFYYLTTDKKLHYYQNEWRTVGGESIEHGEVLPTEYENNKIFVLEKDIDEEYPKGIYISKGASEDPENKVSGEYIINANISTPLVTLGAGYYNVNFKCEGHKCKAFEVKEISTGGMRIIYILQDGLESPQYNSNTGWLTEESRHLDFGELQDIDNRFYEFLKSGAVKQGIGDLTWELIVGKEENIDSVIEVDELPTVDIKHSIYHLSTDDKYYAYNFNTNTWNDLGSGDTVVEVDELPTTDIKKCIYYLKTDKLSYIYNFDTNEWTKLNDVRFKFISRDEFDALSYEQKNDDTLYYITGVKKQETIEYFKMSDVFTSTSSSAVSLSQIDQSKYGVQVINGNLAIVDVYFGSSNKITSAGWKDFLLWNSNWKYKIADKDRSSNIIYYRMGGSMYVNNAYINMAFENQPGSNSIRTYYAGSLVNQTNGINIYFVFPVVTREEQPEIDNTRGEIYKNGVYYGTENIYNNSNGNNIDVTGKKNNIIGINSSGQIAYFSAFRQYRNIINIVLSDVVIATFTLDSRTNPFATGSEIINRLSGWGFNSRDKIYPITGSYNNIPYIGAYVYSGKLILFSPNSSLEVSADTIKIVKSIDVGIYSDGTL